MAFSLKKSGKNTAGADGASGDDAAAEKAKTGKAPKPPRAPKEPKTPKAPKEKSPPSAKEKLSGLKKAKPSRVPRISGKAKRFVLLVGDEGAILVFMQGGKVVRRLFAQSPQPIHTEAMLELLRTNASIPVYVLMDVLDQQYVAHTFPPVSALSLGGLVKRRLDRDFQPEDIKGALQLGRDKTGRKEWRYLLVSLARTPLVAEWVDAVLELPNEVKGVYLVPIESINYLRMLRAQESPDTALPWQMLISYNKVSGVRQVVANEGRLVFTRVSQVIDDAVPAVIAGNIEQDIINTMEYLKRLGFQDSSQMDAYVITAQDVVESLDLRRFAFGGAHALAPVDVAEHLKLEQAALSVDRFGDVVMASAFGVTKKHNLRFATAFMEKLDKLHKAQMAIKMGAGLLAVLLLGLTLMGIADIVTGQMTIAETKDKTVNLEADLEKVQKQVNELNTDVAYKSAVVATYDAYIKDKPKMDDFMVGLAKAVSAKHRVLSVNWANKETEPTKGQPAPTPSKDGDMLIAAKVEFDLSGAGKTPDELSAAADELNETLKTALPNYEIAHEPFPWVKEEKNEAVAVDVVQAAQVSPNDMIAVFNFKGLKKPGATPANGTGAAKP